MLEVIPFSNKEKWNFILNSFKNSDIYYTPEFADAFKIHGDGEPSLWHFYNDTIQGICVLMIRDISNCQYFKDEIRPGTLFDATTPYGYGGFIFNSMPSKEVEKLCYSEFIIEAEKRNIISVFFRFHPILKNSIFAKQSINVIDLGSTIDLNLSSEDIIWTNITSKNRNMIRKAEKSGVIIKYETSPEILDKFKEIYEITMERDNAESYYYFPKEFYDSIKTNLKDNYLVFYAELEGKIIAASIMLFVNGHMSYHLSGSLPEFRNLAPSNLLLYEAAKWGAKNGMTELHLGGGVGSGEDNLYKFKAAFNRNSDNQFSIGKLIVNQEEYDKLVKIRKEEGNFNSASSFFPLYRAK